MGGVDEFAAQICETLNKTTGLTVAVTDRDSVVAAAGSARRDLIGKRISTELEQIMEDRAIYRAQGSERSVYVTDTLDRCCAAIAAPIISEGDALGLVLFVGERGGEPRRRDGVQARADHRFLPSAGTWRAEKGKRPASGTLPFFLLVVDDLDLAHLHRLERVAVALRRDAGAAARVHDDGRFGASPP